MERFIKIFLGNVIISFAYAYITIPNVILNGGVTSFSLCISNYIKMNVAYIADGITLALMMLCLVFLGKDYFVGVVFSSFSYLVTFTVFMKIAYVLPINYYLAIPLAGIMVAFGYSLCINAKASAVSFDTLAIIGNKYNDNIDIAMLTMGINLLVLAFGAYTYSIGAIISGVAFTLIQGIFLKFFLKKR